GVARPMAKRSASPTDTLSGFLMSASDRRKSSAILRGKRWLAARRPMRFRRPGRAIDRARNGPAFLQRGQTAVFDGRQHAGPACAVGGAPDHLYAFSEFADVLLELFVFGDERLFERSTHHALGV